MEFLWDYAPEMPVSVGFKIVSVSSGRVTVTSATPLISINFSRLLSGTLSVPLYTVLDLTEESGQPFSTFSCRVEYLENIGPAIRLAIIG